MGEVKAKKTPVVIHSGEERLVGRTLYIYSFIYQTLPGRMDLGEQQSLFYLLLLLSI